MRVSKKTPTPAAKLRNLVLVLGDQLDEHSAAFDGFDPRADAVWMAEVARESEKVWVAKPRIALFLAAMRHFHGDLLKRGWQVFYRSLAAAGAEWSGLSGKDQPGESFEAQLAWTVRKTKPAKLIVVEPGEWGVREEIVSAASAAGVPLEIRSDRHFLSSAAEFAAHAEGRKQLRMEFFYREMRRKTGVLMERSEPVGGQWNFDHENRESFGKDGPGPLPPPRRFKPDKTTREVLAMVSARFKQHPGELENFDWPVTTAEAQLALKDFIATRLPDFGRWEDAMWSGEPWLYHSRLSAALNLKLLDPREVLAAAEREWREKRAPIASVEGFIRQILGWREYVRGVYWQFMPGYIEGNTLGADRPLPAFYWTGETDMNCLRQALRQTLEHGYAHHIQRLMVSGLFSLLLGVRPREIHSWYLAVYVDAVEWVELPNTLGMSQYADGGMMASKPYIASGKYIQRMSNYCTGCRFDPAERAGPRACPFTTLYWDFLLRHQAELAKNPRIVMQVRNLKRLRPEQKAAIREQATQIRESCAVEAANV
ncbi:MAG: cryptochrome/photolyase family protein [Gammaproteobacteria bacterium]